ncbi:hypothetical protein [Microbacterium sp. ABRD28]|uniref:hypothetical protein n=1 Tax=Microbacterium sp. ABRD28 TaxID=2268461 RepID=UPI000F555DC8|nr:hypothetical protein [Microbacterium sp. ABRD28]AZC13110.1 hypothetical protein DT073_04780 [Microbacterium sp. ABRD28]
MTQQSTVEPAAIAPPRRPVSRGIVFVVGVLLIPFALSAAFNGYGALTVDSAFRMHAATVSGQTIAILTAVLVVVLTVRRHYALPAILAVSLIAMLVTAHAFGAIESSGDLLLTRLNLIAETDRLNP